MGTRRHGDAPSDKLIGPYFIDQIGITSLGDLKFDSHQHKSY